MEQGEHEKNGRRGGQNGGDDCYRSDRFRFEIEPVIKEVVPEQGRHHRQIQDKQPNQKAEGQPRGSEPFAPKLLDEREQEPHHQASD
jgi:hypothetical protein